MNLKDFQKGKEYTYQQIEQAEKDNEGAYLEEYGAFGIGTYFIVLAKSGQSATFLLTGQTGGGTSLYECVYTDHQ